MDETKFLDGFTDDEIAEIIPTLAPSTVERLFNARPTVFEAHLRRKLKLLRARKDEIAETQRLEAALLAKGLDPIEAAMQAEAQVKARG